MRFVEVTVMRRPERVANSLLTVPGQVLCRGTFHSNSEPITRLELTVNETSFTWSFTPGDALTGPLTIVANL